MHTRENLFATKNIGEKKKKKRNRDDECAFNKGNCLHTRLRVII